MAWNQSNLPSKIANPPNDVGPMPIAHRLFFERQSASKLFPYLLCARVRFFNDVLFIASFFGYI